MKCAAWDANNRGKLITSKFGAEEILNPGGRFIGMELATLGLMRGKISKVVFTASLALFVFPAICEGGQCERLVSGSQRVMAPTPTPTNSVGERAKSSGNQQQGVLDMAFCRGKDGEGQFQVELSDTTIGIDITRQDADLVLRFINIRLLEELPRKLDVANFGTPVNSINIAMQGNNAEVVIKPSGDWEQVVYQTGTRFVAEIRSKKARSTYVGERASHDFQNMTILDALKVIQRNTDMQIVVSDTVSGNIALRLQNVPWDQALEQVLASKGLDMCRGRDVIEVAPYAEIWAADGCKRPRGDPLPPSFITESFALRFQKGEDLAALLSNDVHRVLSDRGGAVVDKRTNTLFVQDTVQNMAKISELIKRLDVPGTLPNPNSGR